MTLPASSQRRQAALFACLIGVAVLAWRQTVRDASGMNCVMMMPAMHGPWWTGCPLYIASWAVMMAAMMLPAVTPMVLLFDRISRSRRRTGPSSGGSGASLAFVAGYALVWGGLGIPAYFVTVGVQAAAARWPALAASAPILGAVTLIAAGVFQLSPAKTACLRHCTSPLHFMMHGWRDGIGGAVRMGAHHGAVCALCCAGLMAVLFALGAMSLFWMAIVALLMLAERVLPAPDEGAESRSAGRVVSRAVGVVFVLAGAAALCFPAFSKLLWGSGGGA